ncbi:hypothetical protein A3J17_03730 [Candidatus Curtissbacteria bacterium RIFCSPLOWO2_02_FULL_40_11]|uniref:Transposase IS200-like domain-containing protein n=1 Tax=Candidatus Curtissbacteria bacterium RIFCSPLOWO2_12_FULL_38_9 TaxID=1797735 RepID=A0A1F5IAE7_9BACT|nr:MAG: hypothetical protein A3J17_03730 [Candidatus Curtissbacteria bacterium RIFCSPLOWO2_02_FULL_40_11]OGE13325.1 MAG: hypothetical protein A3G14_04560 [Candidatus Curtissbacteria bacterium RIFCSPLOWO2_12_FULL_38_9]
MPSKNVIKQYVEDGFYHIYNRGVEKRVIFENNQDYKVFLNYLKIYLLPPTEPKERKITIKNYTFIAPGKPLKNYNEKIDLLAYCLMPNHFHLLIKQKGKMTIEKFMRSLSTKYSTYFNKKYDRVGSLFQGPYKAVLVNNDEQLLHLSRYIHLNPVKDSPLHMAYSSYADYLDLRQTSWVNKKTILSFFKSTQNKHHNGTLSYQIFVEDYQQDKKELIDQISLDAKENP